MERIRNLVYDEKKKTIIQKLYLEGQINASKWDEATDNELIKYFDLKIVTFTAIPPPLVTEHLLYDRTPEAVKLAELLIGSDSVRATPYCDSLVGSGKTTFGYKFRQLLQGHTSNTKLLNAVYLYVLFRNDGDLSNPEFIVLEILARVVRRAASIDIVIDTSNIHLFVDSVCRAAGDCKFLFHLDDVGCFEATSLKYGVTIINAIWSIGVLLRDRGHYVFLTGRSAVMHLFEQWKNFDSFKLISLPPLSIESVEKILIDHNAGHAVHLAQKIHSFTAGVPRAVVSVALFYKLNLSFTTFDDHVGEILDCLKDGCGGAIKNHDSESFCRCVELAWAKVPFSVDWSINRKPIVSLLAQICLYRHDLPNHGMFEVVVPPYILALHRPSTRSLMAIWQQPDKGSRLEWSVRRVLHLRHVFVVCTKWRDLSLSILDNLNVVFPKEGLTDFYVLPKIAKKNKWSENQVKKVMDKVHSRELSTVSKSEYAKDALPTLIGLMKLGQYYQCADKSDTVDGYLRCSEDTVLCWQFRDTKDPLKPSEAVEARKCIIEGYKVFLLIICTEGIEGGDAVHYTDMVDGVTVVMLSKDNVNEFLAATNVKLSFKTGLEDASCRVYFSPSFSSYANSVLLFNRSRSNNNTKSLSEEEDSLLKKRDTRVDIENDSISPGSQGKKRVRFSESPTFADEKAALESGSSSSSGSVSGPVVKTGERKADQGAKECHKSPSTNSFYSFFGRLFTRGFM